MAEKKDTKSLKVSDILEDVKTDICDNFCKYSAETENITDSELFEEMCMQKCPLNRL